MIFKWQDPNTIKKKRKEKIQPPIEQITEKEKEPLIVEEEEVK